MLLKLNLGCGLDHRPDFINIDTRADVGADRILDITKPLPFSSNSVETIVAQDILEHLTVQQQDSLLSEISRVLQPHGHLYVRIPNIDDIINRFATDPEVRNLFLYGDTSQSGVWGAHKSGHTPASLTALALLHNLRPTKLSTIDTNYEFEFIKSPSQISLKKITFINQTLGLGGAESFNSQLLNWLKHQGITVSTHIAGKQFIPLAHRIPFVIDLIGDWKGLIKSLLLFPIAIFYYMLLVIKNRKTDIVLMSGFTEKIFVTPWAKLLGIPVVWIEFGPLETIFHKFLYLPKILYSLVKDLPEFIIVPSKHTLVSLVNSAKISRSKLEVIPCAKEVSTYIQKTVPRSVYCVSRLEPGKGQDLLLQAWEEVIRAVPSAHLYIIGTGSLKLKIQKNVTLMGWVPNALKEIAKAQICVFPSHWPLEGFGLVAIEAMAMSKPVVGFNIGPLPEIIDSSCGILVEPGNIKQLAFSIIKLLKNPTLSRKLGQTGRKKFIRNFTFNSVGPKYLQLLLQAIVKNKAYELL